MNTMCEPEGVCRREQRGPTLSPMCICFIRFLASAFRTPSQGVVLIASKSSTLNCGMLDGAVYGYDAMTACLDVFSFDDSRVWLCLH